MAIGNRHYGNIRNTATDWLTRDMNLAVIIVTHDLAVARHLSHRMMVMKDGRVVESGLTDRVLDDPRAPYTQLLVSSILQSFTMHLRDGIKLPVVAGVSFSIKAGECTVLGGPSGAGKSSILKMLYGNYAVDEGQIIVKHDDGLIDLAHASPRTVLAVRRQTIGYVSQFLRTVPRVSALDVVAEPLVERGEERETAREKARTLLAQLNLKLSETPLVHPTAEVHNSTLGRWTEIADRSRVSESEVGDYSYMMQDCAVWCATIGKFANIAASVRLNATNHPTWRPTLHHFTYRASDYWDDAEHESAFFAERRAKRVTI
eukprot:gene38466-51969_t